MATYREFHRRSLEDRKGFWAEQAELIHWHRPYQQVLDYSRPPFARWFVGGQTNLCHNALDRHIAARGEQKALVWISTEVGGTRSFTYQELLREVKQDPAMIRGPGVKRRDRVLIVLSLGRRSPQRIRAPKSTAPGSNRTSLPTSYTPRAPPASPKACNATPAATPSRSPRR